LALAPGPSNPVGQVWIGFAQPGYGLHGTADPAQIDNAQSHGCLRMTNWDARELAETVLRGVDVELLEE
jgi:lipoprotein-anchoring transpeptidase ErfK/SrfK